MVLFEIIGEDEVLDIFKCLSRKQLVTFAISARWFAQLSESAAIHSVHLVSKFRDAVKLAGSNKEEDKQMFLALQNALQYEETRKHYRIVGQFYKWNRARNPHPDQLPFIRQCFPLMSAGLCIVTENYKAEEGLHLEVASKLDFFRGACTEVFFLSCFGQHWHQMLTHPTVLAARELSIFAAEANDELSPNLGDLVNWLWHRQPSDGGNASEWGLRGAVGPERRELALVLNKDEQELQDFAGILKQKFEFSLENNAMPLPTFLLHLSYFVLNASVHQFSIEPIQKMVDSKNNVVAKFEFTHNPEDNSSVLVDQQSWEIRQFYGQMDEQQEKRQKTDLPVILELNYNEETDSSGSELDIEEEDDENVEE